MSNEFSRVVEEVVVVVAEIKELATVGPHFRILHVFNEHGNCLPGELVALVCLVYRSREFPVRLSVALRILFDFLARHRLSQSAAEIAVRMASDPFCMHHGANSKTASKRTRKFSARGVKVYMMRLRCALQHTFREAGLKLDVSEVVVSEPTESNQVSYRIHGSFEWVDLP